MKSLFSNDFRNFKSRMGRFIFAEMPFSDKGHEEVEAEAKLENDNQLDSALSLNSASFQKIKELDEKPGNLENSGNKQKFQTLIEHNLLLAESDYFTSTFPPRILYAVRDSKNLKQYLTAKQLSRIERVFDKERIEVEAAAEKKDWTKFSSSKMLSICAFFETLKHEKSDKKDTELFKKLTKKLYEKAISLLYLREKEEKKWKDPKGDKEKDVSQKDKLLFMEIYRIHPKPDDWKIKYKKWTNSTEKQNANEIVQIFSRETSNEILAGKNDKDTVLFWEILEVFYKEKNIVLSETQGKLIQRRIRRNNAATFLTWAEKQKTVLPDQFKFLEDILLNDDKFKDYEYKLSDTKKEGIVEERLDERTILQENLDELNKLDVNQVQEKFKQGELHKDIEKELKEEGDKFVEFREKIKKIVKDVFSLLEGIKVEDNNKEKKEIFIKEFLKKIVSGERNVEDLIDDLENKIELLGGDLSRLEPFTSHLIKNVKNFEGLYEARRKFKEKLDILKFAEGKEEKKIPLEETEDVKSRKGEDEPKGEKDKKKAVPEKVEILNKEGVYVSLENPEKKAGEVLGNITLAIKERVTNHRILANDLLILFAHEGDDVFLDSVLGPNGSEKIRVIKQIREDVFEKTFGKLFEKYPDKSHADLLLETFDRAGAHKRLLENEGLFAQAFDGDPKLQNRSEIISGLILSYKEQIEDIIDHAPELSPYAKEEFWRNFNSGNRFHSSIDKQGGEGFTNAQKKYLEQKQENDVLVSKQKAEVEKFLAGKDWDEDKKEEIREMAYENRKRFLNGEEDNNKPYVVGADSIATLQLQTAPIADEISETLGDLKLETERIKNQLQDIAKMPEGISKKAATEKIYSRIENLCSEFDDSRFQVIGGVKEMGVIMEDLFGDKFNDFNDYLINLETAWEEINKSFTALKVFSNVRNLDGFEPIFSKITEGFTDFNYAANTKNGFFDKLLEDSKENFDKQSEALQNMDEKGVWDEEGNEQFDEAKVKFEEERKKYNAEYARYGRVIKRTVKALTSDIGDFDDKEFQTKYGFSKDLGRSMISNIASANTQFEDFWKQFEYTGGGGFWDQFAAKWKNGSAHEKAIALDDILYWQNVGDHIKKMADNAEANEEFLKERKENKKKEDGFLGSLNVRFFSLYNIYAIVKQTIEARDRIWKQKMDVITNQIGKDIFGNSAVGKEFTRNLQTAENARMNEFKTAYENDVPTYRLWQILSTSNDKYEIEAIINIFNTRGILRWDDPIIFAAINRLGGKITYNEKDSMLEMRRKMRLGCSRIWSEETFDQWNTGYEGNLKSRREKFHAEFQDDPNADVMRDMLKLWSAGNYDSEEVDPVKYEAFIEFAIKDGKMSLEAKVYYLIMGCTVRNPKTGQTLLSKEAMKRFGQGEFFKHIPQMIFFDRTEHSPKKNGIPYSPEEAKAVGAVDRPWEQDDYEIWRKMIDEGDGKFKPTKGGPTTQFITRVIEQSMDVKQRFNRLTGAPENMDHDDAPSRFAGLTVSMVKDWGINKSDGPNNISPDCWKGFLAGANQWFAKHYEFIRDGDAGKLAHIYPNWPEKKKTLLKEVAEKLRVALALSQLLKKNFYDKPNQSMVLIGEDWTGTAGDQVYGFCAKRDADKFETAIEELWKLNGLDKRTDGDHVFTKEEIEAGEKKRYYREIFEREKMGSGNPDIMEGLKKKNHHVLTNDEFYKDYFAKNLGNVETVLKKFYENGAIDDSDASIVRKTGGPAF